MSAITNLLTLRQALRTYIDRDDIPDATLDLFIDVGRRSAARVKAREQEESATFILPAPSAGPGQFYVPLPARFMAARVVIGPNGENIAQVSGAFADAGAEQGYRVVGGYLEIYGNYAAGDRVQMFFFAYPPELSADTDAGAFLVANADLWLWHAVTEAARYLRNEEMAQAASAALEQIGGAIEKTAREGRQHAGPRRMIARA